MNSPNNFTPPTPGFTPPAAPAVPAPAQFANAAPPPIQGSDTVSVTDRKPALSGYQGQHVVQLLKCEYFNGNKYGPTWASELRVLASQHEDLAEGAELGWVRAGIDGSNKGRMYLGHIKQHIAAMFGWDPRLPPANETWGATWDAVLTNVSQLGDLSAYNLRALVTVAEKPNNANTHLYATYHWVHLPNDVGA